VLSSDKVGLILLGAKEFPSSKFTSSPAFGKAYSTVQEYFCENVFKSKEIAVKQTLDLFDTKEDPNDIDEAIAKFIDDNPHLTELVLYYVGHGDFDNELGFVLAIRRTRDSNLGVSSIVAKSLGKTVSRGAVNRSLYIILDCCFSAELNKSLLTTLPKYIEKEVSTAFSAKGIALLSASSKSKAARILPDESNTMFTSALEQVLKNGSSEIPSEFLTFRQVGDLTKVWIKGKYPSDYVLPEVHTPKMFHADIADEPVFRNAGYAKGNSAPSSKIAAHDIDKKLEEIQDTVRSDDAQMVLKLFIDFIHSYNKDKPISIEEPVLSRRLTRHINKPAPAENDPAYDPYQTERENLFRDVLGMVMSVYGFWEAKFQKNNSA
jgi:hypothetical protein